MIEIQEELWPKVLTYLPKLSAEQLDIVKQTTTNMLQELDMEQLTQTTEED
jgi:hypothetical protein